MADFKKLKEMLEIIAAGGPYNLSDATEAYPNCYLLTVEKVIEGKSEFLCVWLCDDDVVEKAWRYEDLCD